MMTRLVSFFVDRDEVPKVKRRIEEEVLPQFLAIPQFLGFVALQSEGSRQEIVAMSFWEDGLESSEAISEAFRDEIERVTGTTPARKQYNVAKLMVRGPNGKVFLNLPEASS
jgi:hypothetical protein